MWGCGGEDEWVCVDGVGVGVGGEDGWVCVDGWVAGG